MATVIFSSKINASLGKQFDELAAKRGMARNAALKEAIARYVAEHSPSTEKDSGQAA